MSEKNLLAKAVGINIRHHRQRIGVSQTEASRIIGIQQYQWWGFENGDHLPSIITLEKICSYLGVSSEDILGF